MFRLCEIFLINFDVDRDYLFEGIINLYGINSWGNLEEGYCFCIMVFCVWVIKGDEFFFDRYFENFVIL